MIKNYLRIALRSLLKHKFYSFIHIIGLAIGMSVFLLIAQYVRFERSYEHFIPGAENIYRVTLDISFAFFRRPPARLPLGLGVFLPYLG